MNDPSKIESFIARVVAGASVAQIERECNQVDLNEVGIQGRSPLMVAAAEGLLAAVEVLVRNGASVCTRGRGHMTALHEASANGQFAVAKYLLSLGAEIDAESIDGVTPLMCAAAWGNTEVVQLLLERGADGTKVDRTGATAIDIAREKGEDNMAELIGSYLEQQSTR